MRIVHVTWSTHGRQPAFPTEESKRAALWAIASVANSKLVLFALVDDHVHIVLLLLDGALRRLRAQLTRVLNGVATTRFTAPFVQEVTTRRHLERLLSYCLTQPQHHGLAGHPALATGSCFPELVGARRIPGLTLAVGVALPRFQLREAYDAVGLREPLAAATDAELRALGAMGLAQATARALCVSPAFEGNTAPVATARRAAVVLAGGAGLRGLPLAAALGVTPIAAARLANRSVDPSTLQAIRLRVALEAAVHPPSALAREPGPESASYRM